MRRGRRGSAGGRPRLGREPSRDREWWPRDGGRAGLIDCHRAAWQKKPVLRAIYSDYHRLIAAACVPGHTLEIGGGSGHMKSFIPDVVSMDIQEAPWLDLVADAHVLPFADGSIANVVMLDVLHHLVSPKRFLAEVVRVLAPAGRLIMIEPEITPVSRFFLSRLHPEPLDLSVDPFSDEPLSGPEPEDANQALPHLIVRHHGERLRTQFPQLRCVHVDRLSLWAYPLSGGFRPWCLMPGFLVSPLLRLENAVMPALGPLAAFRMLAVIERAP